MVEWEDMAMAIDALEVSLKHWQACLAVAQQRLANPSFRLDIEHSIEDISGPASIKGQASGLTVRVMDTGRDLIKLGMTLECTLHYETETVHVPNGTWEFITSFQTINKNGIHEVLADLADPDMSVDFRAEGLADSAAGVIAAVLGEWVKSRIQTNPFRLFTFNANTGQAAGAQFNRFRVTTAFAKYSRLYSSFLLLMREAQGDVVENELSIDPHILPQGQTAVLWIAQDMLEKTGGAGLVAAAESELTFRPRAMEVDIPQVSDKLHRWSKTIIDNVSIPGGLVFTRMQKSGPGLMLSATPLSIAELDDFTACDVRSNRQNPVQQKAKKLFQDCVLFYMKEKYRTYLLQENKPALPKEVLQVTGPQSTWFATFARLQLAGAIRKSEAKGDHPFTRFSDAKIESLLKAMSLSETFADQTARLYALAFCVAHPRISLYMEDPAKWRPLYIEHLTSDAYADALIAGEDPITRIHEDNSKLTLFDLTGKTAKETLPLTVAAFMRRVTERGWKLFVKEHPDTYKAVLKKMLDAVGKDADTALAPAITSGMAPGSDDLPDGETVKKAIGAAGGAYGIADSLMPLLSKESRQEANVPLAAVIDRSAHLWNDVTGALRKCLTFAASAAALVVLLHEIRKDVSEQTDDAAKTKDILEFSDGFVLALRKGLDIAKIVKQKIGSIVVTTLKAVRWLGKTAIDKLAEAGRVTSLLVFNVKTIAAICGKALSYAAAALSICDAVKNFRGGRIGEGVVSTMSAAVALLGVLSIELSWSGPLSWALIAVSAILAIISIFGFKKVSEGEDAVNELTNELAVDGVVT
jgi:hypothetical protein